MTVMIYHRRIFFVYRGEADCGVFGGWPFLAYQYVMKAVGCAIRNFITYKKKKNSVVYSTDAVFNKISY